MCQGCAIPAHAKMHPLPRGFINRAPRAKGQEYVPTVIEHWANCVSHGIGIAFGLVALVLLVSLGTSTAKLLSAWIYGVGMLCLFTASTSYHVVALAQLRRFLDTFQILDHAVIYIFIAASYTPWLLILDLGENNLWGRVMTAIVWGIALSGIILSTCVKHSPRVETIKLVLYLTMGWLAVFIYEPIMESPVPRVALLHMLWGGLCYTGGIAFFKSDGVIPCAHAIWHLCVLGGVLFHFHAVYNYLMLPVHL